MRHPNAAVMRLLLMCVAICIACNTSAQSLLQQLQSAKTDTTRLRICIAIAEQQTNNNLDTCYYYADKAIALARNLNNPKGIADAEFQKAYAIYYSGAGDSALRMFNRLAADYRALGDSGGVAACYNKAGFIFRERGDRINALKLYQRALSCNAGNINLAEAAGSYLNIGLIHHDQKEYDQALKYELQALSLYQETKDTNRIANALLRIGNVYADMDDDSTALNYYQQALGLSQAAQSNRLIAICFNNIASCYSRFEEHSKALGLYRQALDMRTTIGDLNGSALVLNNIGDEYIQLGSYDSAKFYIDKSYQVSDSIDYKDMLMTNCLSYAQLFAAQNNFEDAYRWHTRYHDLYESINQEESNNEVTRLNALLEAENRDREIERLSQQGLIDDATIAQEKTKGWFLALGLFGVAVAALVISMNNRKTRRLNADLELQKTAIAEQKKIVEEQHRDIVDSINYAMRIQHAVLPSRNALKQLFPESFMLYKARDIVSGDFWWLTEANGLKVLVVADCTGHGVPGAFMSLIGTSLLNEIINEKGITSPGEILNLLNEKVAKSLHQHEDRITSQDGMDIALVVIDEENETLTFAGANNSLYYTDIEGQLHEIKGDRQPIGYYHNKHKPFREHSVSIMDVTNIWMFTDGYADQFCGNAGQYFGKKFKYSRLKNTLIAIQGQNTLQQKEHLTQTFEDWKGNMFQVDDVLLIGIKFY